MNNLQPVYVLTAVNKYAGNHWVYGVFFTLEEAQRVAVENLLIISELLGTEGSTISPWISSSLLTEDTFDRLHVAENNRFKAEITQTTVWELQDRV